MATDQAAFAFYLQHQRVVYYALSRLGVRPQTPDYQDLRQEGMLLYLAYYQQYEEPLNQPAAVQKFNRLAGKMVYLGLLQHRLKWQRRQALEQTAGEQWHQAAAMTGARQASSMSSVLVAEALTALAARLTPGERTILALRYGEQLSNREIALHLNLSPQRVNAVRRQIAVKYLTWQAEQ
ncbi:RNA polymerase sigma factor [Lacticaseibacillus suibinensis]|uniref:RNA polymerase sigma factor n=1 Tax=Lacticaseibacillus suibinensis TaxID=2486011 RepID=UPI0013DDE8E2|nr:sigma-70 family RNA polymerase sigma factor [Lacticaseibacillus suibinensis]